MNVVVSPADPVIAATPLLVTGRETAWPPDPLAGSLPLSELAVAAAEDNPATGRDAPEGPTPLTPTLHAAAAEAPATKLASSAARTGDRCMAGAERFTTASGEGRLVESAGTASTATPSSADSSLLESAGVAELRKELSMRRSASTATRQP